ncbi:hypothetical protein FH609_006325 [Streptomyces sp. 3MP-14]|uniref:JAB1/MPN/MOV34 metalloenzyme domain-containing protein n=1 Tax=Streptomyces mimosae TaxID=2586635 RepID=A0A5N6AMH3_9ACTN|nr:MULTISPECIES: caspase family protein [Streptomyces]KAB8169881.1 hypothetical protein FH607_004005 [Streptomyces mimosae]KAB8178629.1 hypothetical protein FH609_006325 [Streptomyces sp. 3MP-14]
MSGDTREGTSGLPDPAGTRAVLIGVSDYRELPPLPGVATNLAALRDLFTAPDLLGLREEHCVVLGGRVTPDAMDRAVSAAAREASDTLLLYFAGHGLLDAYDGALHLSWWGTDPERVHATTLPYAWVRRALPSGPQRRVVVLDCCFSGRALNSMAGEGIGAVTAAEGTAVLAAAHENRVAAAPPDEPHTAFTGEIVALLSGGIPGGPELLSVEDVFHHAARALRAKGRPEPQGAFRNTARRLALGRNRAWAAPDVVIPQPPAGFGGGPAGAGLTIGRDMCERIVELARRARPHQACGMVAGPIGSDRPERLIPIRNGSPTPTTHWEFDHLEALRAFQSMERNGEEPIVTYHSRPEPGAYLSKLDIALLDERRTGRHLVVVAVPAGTGAAELRSHRISDSRVMEEAVRVVPELPDPRLGQPGR